MARNPLEYAYKNDFVDTVDFSERTLDKYLKIGLLENKHPHGRVKGRQVYWISKKGLKCYLGKLPKNKCRVSKKRNR